ncbi:hypothetical protein D9615_006159 [Tricholomella constricta]|uniref:Uncharacterized protein n=1 Tax=Tricholomella constricta TaxID=117010 RepID=A0A8H5M459_9AGAR|nr:hypothetical protein D9615_006159 [Tricholomella constricta]
MPFSSQVFPFTDEALRRAGLLGEGTDISPDKVTAMFYPQSNTRTAFKYPDTRKLKIRGIVTRELLANPDLFDSENRPCLIVGKDRTKTGLTFGRYAGLESFLCDELGVESIELGIYNWGKNSGIFADTGDCWALVWDGNGRIVGQLHSGQSKGGSSNSHVTYATPGWWLLNVSSSIFLTPSSSATPGLRENWPLLSISTLCWRPNYDPEICMKYEKNRPVVQPRCVNMSPPALVLCEI